MLEHLVLYPSVVFVAVLGLSHSALRSVAAGLGQQQLHSTPHDEAGGIPEPEAAPGDGGG